MQTSATLGAELAQILHGAFTGMIEATCERGKLLRWEIQETLKSGRVERERPEPRDPDRFARELAVLLQGAEGGFTGRLVLHCNDGAVVRYVRHRTLLPGQLVPLEE